MADLSIPSEEFKSLAKLIDLDENLFIEFLKALSETPPALASKAYIFRLIPRLPKFEQEQLSQLTRTVVALYRVKESLDQTPDGTADLILQASKESEHKDKFTGLRAEKLKQRLTQLLSLDHTLGLGTKCIELMQRGHCLQTKVSLDAEMRPVFSSDGKTIAAAAIVFDLRINCLENQKRKELFLTLDEEDVQSLKKELEKAETRCSNIKEFLKNQKVFFLNND